MKCSVYFADIEENGGSGDEFGQKVTVKKYFTKGGVNPDPSVEMKEVRRNSAAMDSKDDTSSKYGSAEYDYKPTAEFPEGTQEGERLYLVIDSEDDFDAGVRFRSYWEYTWVNGPEEEFIPWKLEYMRKKPNPFYEEDRP